MKKKTSICFRLSAIAICSDIYQSVDEIDFYGCELWSMWTNCNRNQAKWKLFLGNRTDMELFHLESLAESEM